MKGANMEITKKRQLSLRHFCEQYEVAERTAHRWIRTVGFPAYKIMGKWYIDIVKYEEWREKYRNAAGA